MRSHNHLVCIKTLWREYRALKVIEHLYFLVYHHLLLGCFVAEDMTWIERLNVRLFVTLTPNFE